MLSFQARPKPRVERHSPPALPRRRLASAVSQAPLACACGGGCPRCGARGNAALERDADARASKLTSGITVPAGRRHDGGLDSATRAFFEQGLDADLSAVRLHVDGEAARDARQLGARAFTFGDEIGFAAGAWDPASRSGQALLAHELAHVAQQRHLTQRGSNDAAVHLKKEKEPSADEVAQDPSLLLCFILCEIGVPPAIWRVVTGLMMKAVWEEYRETYGELQGQTKFRAFQLAFKAYSPIRAIKAVLVFIVQGKIAHIPIRTAGAAVLRKQMEAMLIKRGATAAGIIAAEQIARKVVIVIEAAIAAGCLTYCGAVSGMKAIEEFAVGVAEGLAAGVEALETAGEIAGGMAESLANALVLRPTLAAMASLDPLNWELGALPSALAKQDMLALGLYWSSMLKDKGADELLPALAKPVSSSVAAADLVRSVVREIEAQRAAEGLDPLPATADEFAKARPFQVVSLLVEHGHLGHVIDPSAVVDEMFSDQDDDQDQDD